MTELKIDNPAQRLLDLLEKGKNYKRENSNTRILSGMSCSVPENGQKFDLFNKAHYTLFLRLTLRHASYFHQALHIVENFAQWFIDLQTLTSSLTGKFQTKKTPRSSHFLEERASTPR